METAMANAKEIVESMENSEQNRQETSRHQADLVCPGVLSRMNKNKTQKRTNDKWSYGNGDGEREGARGEVNKTVYNA